MRHSALAHTFTPHAYSLLDLIQLSPEIFLLLGVVGCLVFDQIHLGEIVKETVIESLRHIFNLTVLLQSIDHSLQEIDFVTQSLQIINVKMHIDQHFDGVTSNNVELIVQFQINNTNFYDKKDKSHQIIKLFTRILP